MFWGRGFGRRFGRGFGYSRWAKAQEVGDPDRAMFGLGPCGEAAYQEYKKKKETEKKSESQ